MPNGREHKSFVDREQAQQERENRKADRNVYSDEEYDEASRAIFNEAPEDQDKSQQAHLERERVLGRDRAHGRRGPFGQDRGVERSQDARDRAAERGQSAGREAAHDRNAKYPTRDGIAWHDFQLSLPSTSDTDEDGNVWVQRGAGEPELMSLDDVLPTRGRARHYFWTAADNYGASEPVEEEELEELEA